MQVMQIPIVSQTDCGVDAFGDCGSTQTVGYTGSRPGVDGGWALWAEVDGAGLYLNVLFGVQEDESDSTDHNDFRQYVREMDSTERDNALLRTLTYMNTLAGVLRTPHTLAALDRILVRNWGMARHI